MKPITSLFTTVVIILLFMNFNLKAGERPTSGIGFRGSYWDVVKGVNDLRVRDYRESCEVEVGGYGGSFFFFSRIRNQLFLEFSLGAIGAVRSRNVHWHGEDVDAAAVVPLLFGIRYDFLPLHVNSVLQPYASLGVGAYWLSDIKIREQGDIEEEVMVKSFSRPGAFAGVGFNFLLTDHLAINYDLKYHLADFHDTNFKSGFELGLGFIVMWGNNKK